MSKTFHIAISAVLYLNLLPAQATRTAEVELKAAQHKAEVEGDLNGAIKKYRAVASKYAKTDRAAAAMALVRMAEAYQKMGDVESQKIYEQIVRDYADQKDAVMLARTRLGGGGKPARQTNTLVWSGSQMDFSGTISHDGRYVSFPDWDTGDIALREIATGQVRRLTNTPKDPNSNILKTFAEESAISRDSKQVAYSFFDKAKDRYELRLANVTGDPNPRRLYDELGNEWLEPRDWSPDGKWIAVMVTRKVGDDRLGLISVTDGSFRVLRNGNWPGNTRVFFSPDGKYLGYDLPENNNTAHPRDVFVFSLEANREIPAVVRRGDDTMIGWSADGKRLLFASDRTGSFALWALPFTNGMPHGAPELIKYDLGAVEPLGVTHSGALYYGRQTGAVESSVHLASFDYATGKISSSREVTQDYLQSNDLPWWSPDGKHLAYVSRRGPASRSVHLLVVRSPETNPLIRELPNKMGFFTGWAPDGRSFLGSGWHEGRTGAFQMDAQTGEISPLVLDPPNQPRLEWPVMSPDGRSLYFKRMFSNGTEYAFFQRDLASGVEKELIRRPFLGGVGLSPDGKYFITASVDPSTNSRVMLLFSVGGGEVREVMRVASEVNSAEVRNYSKGQSVSGIAWAPDSSSFLISRSRSEDKSLELWRISVPGGVPRKLDLPLDRKINRIAIHPDGRQVAYVVKESGTQTPPQSQIWALENFLPATSATK